MSVPDARAAIASREVAYRGALRAAVASACGLRHRQNEDAHSPLDGRSALFVVTDGVGGGALATRASRELVLRLHAALEGVHADGDALRSALLDADRAIARSIARRTEARGAATVALCTATDRARSRWLFAWVGDCRVLRVRAGERHAERLTDDDSYRRFGERAPHGGSPDDPARMIGNGAVDAPNVGTVDLAPGAMLVLVSDGVHKHASAAEIGAVMREPVALAARCARLVELARTKGSVDDATVLAIERDAAPRSRVPRRLALAMLAAALAGGLGWWLAMDVPARAVVPQAIGWQGGER